MCPHAHGYSLLGNRPTGQTTSPATQPPRCEPGAPATTPRLRIPLALPWLTKPPPKNGLLWLSRRLHAIPELRLAYLSYRRFSSGVSQISQQASQDTTQFARPSPSFGQRPHSPITFTITRLSRWPSNSA